MRNVKINKRQIFNFRQWTRKKYAVFKSLKKIIKICTLAIGYTIIAKPGLCKAQSIDTFGNKVYELDEVVVQSTLIEQKNAETGRSIEVIQGSQIQNLPVVSIDELLKYVPGLEGKSRNGFGVQTDFSIRGCNFNQVLVLIDGVKINDPLTAHFNSNIPVSPSEIDRIEIIRGPASAEYGPDATGGIINIITKTFSKEKQKSPLTADARILFGQENLVCTQGGLNYNSDKFKIGGGFLLNKSTGQLLKTGLRSDFNVNTISLSGSIQVSPAWSLSARTARDSRDFNAQRFYTSLPIDSAHETIVRYRQQMQLTRKVEKSITSFQASLLNTNDNYLLFPSYSASINKTSLFNLQLNNNFLISRNLNLAIGCTADWRSILSNNRGNHSLFHTGIFSLILFKPVEQLTINTGIRTDYDQSYKLHFLPQASISYQPLNRLLFRTSFGKSIRAADFTENYYNNEIKYLLSANQRLGNPFLKAEQSWSAEAGMDYNIIPGLIFSITGFNRWSTNLIDYEKTPARIIRNNNNLYIDSTYLYALNISKLNTSGLETRIGYRKNIAEKFKVSFTGGFTLVQSKNSTGTVSLYISSHAKQLFNSEFTIEYGSLSASVNCLYKKRDNQFSKQLDISLSSEYMVWNVSADWDVYKNKVFLTFTIDNVFDVHYSDILGAEMPQRWIMGGIKVRV